jgi:hypothetical protein
MGEEVECRRRIEGFHYQLITITTVAVNSILIIKIIIYRRVALHIIIYTSNRLVHGHRTKGTSELCMQPIIPLK